MTSYVFIIAPGTLACVVLLALLYRRIYQVEGRTAEQVLPGISPLGAMGVHELFSAVAEDQLRTKLTPAQFRHAQRHRIVLAVEYIRRISHNARLLQQWAVYEVRQARATGNQESAQLCADLITSSVKCRICSFILLTRLNFLRFRIDLVPSTSPNFRALIRFGSADILELYCSMRTTASLLSRSFSQGTPAQLAQLL